jgi:hypothetical protein
VKLSKKIYYKSWDLPGKIHVFHPIFLGRFLAFTAKNGGRTIANFSRPTVFFWGWF